MGHLPSDAVATEAELREAVGSSGPGLGSFVSGKDEGRDRVVPNNPAKEHTGFECHLTSQPWSLGFW